MLTVDVEAGVDVVVDSPCVVDGSLGVGVGSGAGVGTACLNCFFSHIIDLPFAFYKVRNLLRLN